MTNPVLLCADGSEISTRALAAGLELLRSDATVIVATVAEELDPMLVTGTGFASGVMSADTFEQQRQDLDANATETARQVATTLGLTDPVIRVLHGDPAQQLCQLAADENASAMVIGSRGHGGFRRALLGSVSDHVVRHAPCPVIVTNEAAEDNIDAAADDNIDS